MKQSSSLWQASGLALTTQLAEEYKAVAGRLNIPFIDTTAWHIEFSFDGVHFAEAGHHIFAEQLARYLK